MSILFLEFWPEEQESLFCTSKVAKSRGRKGTSVVKFVKKYHREEKVLAILKESFYNEANFRRRIVKRWTICFLQLHFPSFSAVDLSAAALFAGKLCSCELMRNRRGVLGRPRNGKR